MIEVVTTIIISGKRVLLTQRPPDKDHPYLWESPGGKVEPGETQQDAVRRECLEELSLKIGEILDEPLFSVEAATGVGEPCRVTAWEVRTWNGWPQPNDQQGIGWFTADEVIRLNLAPGNKKALPMLLERLRS